MDQISGNPEIQGLAQIKGNELLANADFREVGVGKRGTYDVDEIVDKFTEKAQEIREKSKLKVNRINDAPVNFMAEIKKVADDLKNQSL